MKKLIITITITAAILTTAFNKADAQVKVTVVQNSIHHYKVTPVPDGANYDYHWSVTGGTTTVLSGIVTNTTGDIKWDGIPGKYTLGVYATNPLTGCSGFDKTIEVTIVAMGEFAITGPTENVCPYVDRRNQSGDFDIKVTYGGTDAWEFVLNDGVSDKTYSVEAGTSFKIITIPGYVNPSATDVATHTFRLVSVTTNGLTVTYNGSETDADKHSFTVKVNPTPATSDIIQD